MFTCPLVSSKSSAANPLQHSLTVFCLGNLHSTSFWHNRWVARGRSLNTQNSWWQELCKGRRLEHHRKMFAQQEGETGNYNRQQKISRVKGNGLQMKRTFTFGGGTWGSAGSLCWAGKCSSYRSSAASGAGSQYCWDVACGWFAWWADSTPHHEGALNHGRSAGCLG